MKFVVTGSGRCGTSYLARLLTEAGTPCGHESVFDFRIPDTGPEWGDWLADSSWQAVPYLDRWPHPTVLLVRHPLKVVNSYIELGFMSPAQVAVNPVHATLRAFAPQAYEQPTEQGCVLYVWWALTRAALKHAELVFRIEEFGADEFGRLLGWCGGNQAMVPDAMRRAAIAKPNDFAALREASGRRGASINWDDFRNRGLVAAAQDLAGLLGYGVAA